MDLKPTYVIYDIIIRFFFNKESWVGGRHHAVCIQYKFINEVMYVNDTGAEKRASRNTIRLPCRTVGTPMSYAQPAQRRTRLDSSRLARRSAHVDCAHDGS